ncbi:unnamed protein product [Absidia cylindrospora]
MMNLGDFPIPILSLIIKYVDMRGRKGCSLVSKQFHIVANPHIWHVIPILSQSTFIKVATTIMKRNRSLGRHVRALILVVPFKDRTLLSFLEHLPLLESLCLPGTTMHTTPDTVF